RADSLMIETAFLPDQSSEEIARDAMGIGIGPDEQTYAIDSRCFLFRGQGWRIDRRIGFARGIGRNSAGQQDEKLQSQKNCYAVPVTIHTACSAPNTWAKVIYLTGL